MTQPLAVREPVASAPVSLAHLALEAAPYPHGAAPACIDEAVADELLDWFEDDAPWTLVACDFYEQYEFDLSEADHPAARRLTSGGAMEEIGTAMGTLFGVRIARPPRIVAHRLVPGHRIDIHNDNRPGGETHRLLIQLNRGLADGDGGMLMLFNSERATDVARIYRPQHRSGAVFAISDRSYHAVSRVHGGTRYTLVYSFHADAR